MKTPYDTALRMRRYEADRLRVEAARLGAELRAHEAALTAHDASLAKEAARSGPFEGYAAYATRMRAERLRLEHQILETRRKLDGIEAGVLAAFRDLKPLEQAAADYEAARRARQARQEQATFDDLAGRQFAYPAA